MTLLAAKAIERMEHALYGESAIPFLDLLNEAGETFCNAREWDWMGDGQVTLPLISGQDWVDLPYDFAEATAMDGATSLENAYQNVSPGHIHSLRTGNAPMPSSYFSGLVIHEAEPIENLLAYTGTLEETTVWTARNITVTDGTTEVYAPDGSQTAIKLDDASLTDTGRIWQQADATTLVDGRWYCASVYVYAGTGSAVKAILESTADKDGGFAPAAYRIQAKETFSVTSGVVAQALLESTNMASGDTLSGVVADTDLAVLGWYRCWVAFRWKPKSWMGKDEITLRLEPSPAAASGVGTCYVWGPQINEGPYPTDLVENDTEEPLATGRPRPRLDIWPAPGTTDLEGFAIRYRKKWARVSSDDDTLYIPEFCEVLFLRFCEEVALGLNESEHGVLEQRIDRLKASNLFDDCARADQARSGSSGTPRNGAAQVSRSRLSSGALESFVSNPS